MLKLDDKSLIGFAERTKVDVSKPNPKPEGMGRGHIVKFNEQAIRKPSWSWRSKKPERLADEKSESMGQYYNGGNRTIMLGLCWYCR